MPRFRSQRRGQSRGFTLLELLTAVGVGGVLLALAAPAFGTMVRTSRLAAQGTDFVAALQLARSEALRRGVPVTVCRSTNALAADASCAGAGPWEDGWIVFAETAGASAAGGAAGRRDAAAVTHPAGAVLTQPAQMQDGAIVPASGLPLAQARQGAGEAVLRAHGPLPRPLTLRGNANVIRRVTFNAQGMSLGGNGTFRLCDDRGAPQARWVVTARTGQIRLCSDLADPALCNRASVDGRGTALACP